ncbi:MULTISPECIES: alternative ribosome rescue aminoacyl-tRNA hydrolase ArfB [Anaerolinea]|uniref:alternative ribosome rescue aminoacyl-tRNA hydrolase ArfB n=1 Tax=Anaerolinea TaxID=233189 RepID=UPI002630F529|nr:alternative ribosome rescue aminoacyl-tRNA hydrolase ArfB [Anaerolinea thermophila]
MNENRTLISIPPEELRFTAIRATGPGGQNVNKVSTAVQLHFDVLRSRALPADVKERLVQIAGKRINEHGVLILDARAYRSQEQNRADALRRLYALIEKAMQVPKVRKKTQPSGGGRAREKRHLAEKKRMRRLNLSEWEE